MSAIRLIENSNETVLSRLLARTDLSTNLLENSQCRFWITLNDTELIGLCYMYGHDVVSRECTIGYGLLPKFRGQGFSFSVLETFSNALREAYDLSCIHVEANPSDRS